MSLRQLVLILFVVGLVSIRTVLADEKPTKQSPKFSISKETTYVTKHLTKDGFPDYAAEINARLGKGVTPDNNAAVMFYRALGPAPDGVRQSDEFFRLLQMPVPKDDGKYMLTLGKFLTNHLKLDAQNPRYNAIIEEQGKAGAAPWTEKEMPDIALWLDLNQEPLASVTAGSKRTRYYSPLVPDEENPGLVNVSLPGIQQSRAFARALTARAMLHLGRGSVELAWNDLLTCHRIGRLTARGPTLIEALVGIAIDRVANSADLVFLETVKPNSKRALAYLKQLEQLPSMTKMVNHVNFTERCMFLDCTFLVARGGKDEMKSIGADAWLKAWSGFFDARQIEWDVVLKKGNVWYDKIVKAMQIENRQARVAAFDQFAAELKELSERSRDKSRLITVFLKSKSKGEAVADLIGDVLIALMLPALRQAQAAEERSIQGHRNLRVAFALAAYRSDNDKYPKQLGQISPKYLKQIPNDLFTQRELIYERTDEGYLLYSFGVNGKDDNGRWYADQPTGDDIRVRMPMKK